MSSSALSSIRISAIFSLVCVVTGIFGLARKRSMRNYNVSGQGQRLDGVIGL